MPTPSPRSSLLRRPLAIGLTASVAAFGAVAALPAAQAATGAVEYSCSGPVGPTTWLVDIDTSAPVPPSVMFVGDSVEATAVTALPVAVARWAVDVEGAESFSGTARWTLTEGQVSRAVDLAIPVAPLVEEPGADVPVTATGAYVATTPGVQAPTVADLEILLVLHREDGTSEQHTIACEQAPGPARVVDTITVVARSTTTLNLDNPASHHGERVTATAQVVTQAGAPDGDVAFTLDGVATKARVAKDGTASWQLPTVPVGSHTLTASFVPRAATYHRGSTSAAATPVVRKATTRTRLSVSGKRTSRGTRVTAKVRAAHGTTATGRVRLVLRRIGMKRTWVRGRVLDEGQRTVGFGRLGKGRYKLVVRYSGDRNHTRGPEAVRKFRVKAG